MRQSRATDSIIRSLQPLADAASAAANPRRPSGRAGGPEEMGCQTRRGLQRVWQMAGVVSSTARTLTGLSRALAAHREAAREEAPALRQTGANCYAAASVFTLATTTPSTAGGRPKKTLRSRGKPDTPG